MAHKHWHTYTLNKVWGGVGWDATLPSHLQGKNGTQTLAHIHVEQSVGWGGVLTFPGTCKARMAHKHWHTYTLKKVWGGVGCYPSLTLARQEWHTKHWHTYTLNKVWGGVGWDVNIPHIPRWEWIHIYTYIYIYIIVHVIIYIVNSHKSMQWFQVALCSQNLKRQKNIDVAIDIVPDLELKLQPTVCPPGTVPWLLTVNVEHIQWMSFKTNQINSVPRCSKQILPQRSPKKNRILWESNSPHVSTSL